MSYHSDRRWAWTFVALALLLAPVTARAASPLVDPAWEERIREGVFLVADTRFDEGMALFEEYRAAHPRDPAGSFFLAAAVQEKIQKRNDLSLLPEFYRHAEQTMALCRRRMAADGNDIAALTLYGAVKGYTGMLEARQRNLIRAFVAAIEAKNNLERAVELGSRIPDTWFGLGMVYYFASRKADEEGGMLAWLIRTSITHGEDMRGKGIALVQRAMDGDALSRDYAAAALMWIRLFDKDYARRNEWPGRSPGGSPTT